MSTVNGWTNNLPTVDGDYFSRVDEYDKCPALIRLENDTTQLYEMGQGGNLIREYAAEDYEYLGPFTASDFQQLAALRHELAERDRLIVHMRVHSGYTNNGYMQMTTPQKVLYDAIWNRSVAELDAEDRNS